MLEIANMLSKLDHISMTSGVKRINGIPSKFRAELKMSNVRRAVVIVVPVARWTRSFTL